MHTGNFSHERPDVTWRHEFPSTTTCVHFNHAGVAPVSCRVADAVAAFIADARDFAALHYAAWERRAEAVRTAAAQLIGAAAAEVAFVASTSDGLSILATGFLWAPGDSVVTAAGEFPANVYPWWGLMPRGVETRMAEVENGRLTVDALAAVVDRSTRIVSVSAVDFACGQRRPLAAIGDFCRQRGILFCVDAIQALGALAIDVERDAIDCLAADGHKWLCAPEGCGVLYLSRRWLERVQPQRLGWKSVIDQGRYLPYHFELKSEATKFECGSFNFLGISALGAAIDLVLEVGPLAMERRVLAVTEMLRAALRDTGHGILSPERRDEWSGITTVESVRAPEIDVTRLRAAGVIASPRGGGVRLSPHFYSDADDVARCVRALGSA
ncbi:MAG: aminotransferase class V-fold PLP-dependent enzyme [Deltaproteobacteria bacterium]|nr:aminotransferase class V-fold PLP-dependent enzyme [Deltaproteobacteria bacterium]